MEQPPDFRPLFRLLRDAVIACVLILLWCSFLLWVMT